MITSNSYKLEDDQSVFGPKTHPLLDALLTRIFEWRCEIGLKTCPDPEWLAEAFERAQKAGLNVDFFIYVVGGCEWFFRVLHPSTITLKKALRHRLATPGYSPYGSLFDKMLRKYPFRTQGVPSVINRYVDERIAWRWKGQASEMSRFLMRGRINQLVKEFDRPFLASTLQPLPPKQGGYPWLAPWVAGTVIYKYLRREYTQKQNQMPKEVSLSLASALLERPVDDSQFHRKRRMLERRVPKITELFQQGFKNFLVGHRETIKRLMEQDHLLSIAYYWLPDDGLRLLEPVKGEKDLVVQKGE